MRLLLTGRAVEITPALRQLVARKLAKLDRMLPDSIGSAQVVLTQPKRRCHVEITVHARGDHVLHGIGDAPRWQPSLGQAMEKAVQQAQKLKGKWKTRKRRTTNTRPLKSAGGDKGSAAEPGDTGPGLVGGTNSRTAKGRRYSP